MRKVCGQGYRVVHWKLTHRDSITLSEHTCTYNEQDERASPTWRYQDVVEFQRWGPVGGDLRSLRHALEEDWTTLVSCSLCCHEVCSCLHHTPCHRPQSKVAPWQWTETFKTMIQLNLTFFFVVLEFELRASHLLYHFNYTSSPPHFLFYFSGRIWHACLEPASDCNPSTYAFHIAGITGSYYQVWLIDWNWVLLTFALFGLKPWFSQSLPCE
jgi:hypothetical protein